MTAATNPSAPGAAGSGPRTTEEQKQALDGDLDSSLSEFDRMLLREQELLAEEQAAQAAASGSGSGGGGSSGGSFGEEAAPQTADASGGYAAEGGTGDSPDTPPGEASEVGASVGGKEKAESTNGRIPPDVGDGNGDDIVARQLREAAIKEEDPELREKLWDEYHAYKSGTTRGNN